MVKAVIFDLDGTLLNTLADLSSSTNYALGHYGYPQRTIDEVRRFVGNGVAKLIERAVPEGTSEADVQRVLSCFKSHYLEHSLDTTVPYDGIMDMLSVLKKKGIATAIVSNKLDPAVRELHEHFFKELVDTAVGESSERQAKPSPDMVNEALRRLGIDAESAVYVGDSEVDIMTARNAGMRCISVSWGFKTREFLVQNGASSIAGTVEELMEQIDRA